MLKFIRKFPGQSRVAHTSLGPVSGPATAAQSHVGEAMTHIVVYGSSLQALVNSIRLGILTIFSSLQLLRSCFWRKKQNLRAN